RTLAAMTHVHAAAGRNTRTAACGRRCDAAVVDQSAARQSLGRCVPRRSLGTRGRIPMKHLLDCVYALLLLIVSPFLLYKSLTTGKYRKGMLNKFLGLAPTRHAARPCVWFHAVSVGEVLLLRQVIACFRNRWPEWECVLSTTTNTGFDVARKNY